MPAPHVPQRERDVAKASKLWGEASSAPPSQDTSCHVWRLSFSPTRWLHLGPPRLKPDPLVSKENLSLPFLHLCDVQIAPAVEARQWNGSFPGFSGMERSECS